MVAPRRPKRSRPEPPAPVPDRPAEDTAREPTKLTPAKEKIGEGKGNLRDRGAAFTRRRGRT